MEKPLYIILFMVIGLLIIVVATSVLNLVKQGGNEQKILLNQACLELIKKTCNETLVSIDSKNFESICRESGLEVKECKEYCGCKS